MSFQIKAFKKLKFTLRNFRNASRISRMETNIWNESLKGNKTFKSFKK